MTIARRDESNTRVENGEATSGGNRMNVLKLNVEQKCEYVMGISDMDARE